MARRSCGRAAMISLRDFLTYSGVRRAAIIGAIGVATLDATITLAQIVRPPPGKAIVRPPGKPPGKPPSAVPRAHDQTAPELKEFNDLEASRRQDSATQQRILREAIESTTQKVSSLFERAEPNIVRELSASRAAPTEEQIRNIIEMEIGKEILKESKSNAASPVEIKLLEGKAKIDTSFFIGGVKITGGEVNFGKFLLGLGASVFACNAKFGTPDFIECLKAAYHQFLHDAAEEMASKMKSEFDDKQRSSSGPHP